MTLKSKLKMMENFKAIFEFVAKFKTVICAANWDLVFGKAIVFKR